MTGNIFRDLENAGHFVTTVTEYLSATPSELRPVLSCEIEIDPARVAYAHGEYMQNLSRFALYLQSGDPDHPQTVAWRDELMKACNVTQSPVLHYYKLKPDRRIQAAEILGMKSARALCILSHKENMRAYYNPVLGKFDAQKFYNWCSRLLLERVIELAELDARQRRTLAEPLRLIFSENLGHDYEAMFNYFELLNGQADRGDFVLKPKSWKSALMKRDLWSVRPHGELAGLQLADVVASAFLQGANSNASNHDIRPATKLGRILARGRNGEKANAGLTLWPLAHQGPIPASAWPLFERFGYVLG